MRTALAYTRIVACVALVAMLFVACQNDVRAQTNAGIGTIAPNTSALLDLTSITSGLLPPRMTQAQRNLIALPATGDLVFCTDSTGLLTPSTYYYYNGSAWVPFMGNYISK